MGRDEGARSLGQAWTVAPGAFDPTSAGGPQPAPERHRRLRRRQQQPHCLCLPAVSLCRMFLMLYRPLSRPLSGHRAATRIRPGPSSVLST
jgi:hypothetical protein